MWQMLSIRKIKQLLKSESFYLLMIFNYEWKPDKLETQCHLTQCCWHWFFFCVLFFHLHCAQIPFCIGTYGVHGFREQLDLGLKSQSCWWPKEKYLTVSVSVVSPAKKETRVEMLWVLNYIIPKKNLTPWVAQCKHLVNIKSYYYYYCQT